MQPTIGRIVIYTLTAQDAEQINRRRTTGRAIAERIPEGKWPLGAQAHIGNEAQPGQDCPMLVVRTWPGEFGEGRDGVNGQVFLDGNDTLWVTSAKPDNAPDEGPEGHWRTP